MMIKKWKVWGLVVTGIVIAGVLAGCAETSAALQDSIQVSENGETMVSGGAEVELPLVIASNGKTDYSIWYAEELGAYEDVMQAVGRIQEVIADKTGVSISCSSDINYKENEQQQPAILIGRTAFDESQDLDALYLKEKEYYVGISGNKILIYSPDPHKSVQAINYFVNEVLKLQKAADKKLVFSEEKIKHAKATYGIDNIACLGAQLADYRLVIPRDAHINELFLARNIRYYLLTQYGHYLELAEDSTPQTEYEILIGDTERTTVSAQGSQFTVSAGEGKLQLIAADMLGYQALYDYVVDKLLAVDNNKECVIPEGFSYTAEAHQKLDDGTSFASEKLGDVRIIFYNVWSWEKNENGEALRQKLQVEMINTYQPDVIGLQEYSSTYHEKVTPMLDLIGYEAVPISTEHNNWTPLFYRADRLDVTDCGYILFKDNDSAKSKGAAWAVFQVKGTEKQFIAINTHLMYNASGIDANAARVANAQEIVALAEELRSEEAYKNLPVIAGGDLNSNVHADPMKTLNDGGLQDAWNIAQVKNDNRGNHETATYLDEYETYYGWTYPSGDYRSIYSLDHICVTEEAVVGGFGTLLDIYALISSDHVPELVDILLN